MTDQQPRPRPTCLVDILREYAGVTEDTTLGETTRRIVESLTPKEREILRKRLGKALEDEP